MAVARSREEFFAELKNGHMAQSEGEKAKEQQALRERIAWTRTDEGMSFIYDDPLPERLQRREDVLRLFNKLDARDQNVVLRLVQALNGL